MIHRVIDIDKKYYLKNLEIFKIISYVLQWCYAKRKIQQEQEQLMLFLQFSAFGCRIKIYTVLQQFSINVAHLRL